MCKNQQNTRNTASGDYGPMTRRTVCEVADHTEKVLKKEGNYFIKGNKVILNKTKSIPSKFPFFGPKLTESKC